jgi:hypothetical protein
LGKTVIQTSEKRIRIYVFFRHSIQKIPGILLWRSNENKVSESKRFPSSPNYLVRLDCILCAR